MKRTNAPIKSVIAHLDNLTLHRLGLVTCLSSLIEDAERFGVDDEERLTAILARDELDSINRILAKPLPRHLRDFYIIEAGILRARCVKVHQANLKEY